MKAIFSRKSFTIWCRLALLIFVCYDLLWVPVLWNEEKYTWGLTVNSLTIDLMVCAVISFINCMALSVIKARFEPKDWTNKKIGLMIFGIAVFNIAVCFPFAIMKWWLYDSIFHDVPWSLGENWIDNYVLSSVTTIIMVSYMLIWVTSALRRQEKFVAEAKIKSIKNQINPHFLFNNLNAGISLIDYAPDKAVDFFTSMSRVFRTVLDRSLESTQPLKDEIGDLRQYLNLIQIRFGDAMNIDCWISEEESKRMILSGALQLIFENIVKHNKFSADNPMSVSLLTNGDSLMVVNDYRPLSEGTSSHGIGQSAIIHRYEDFGRHNISFRREGNKYVSQIPLFPAK